MRKLALLILLLGTSAGAETMGVQGGDVKFTAVAKPGFLKIRGESKDKAPTGQLEFKDEGVKGAFAFDLRSLETGIDMRNEHMKEKYLEVGKFPTATFALDSVAAKASDLDKDLNKTFSGQLTLHGETKPVSGDFAYSAKERKIVAKFPIKVSDFKIDVPKYLGVTVGESVDVEVSLKLK